MQLTYIYHSGYAIEAHANGDCTIIIDYYRDSSSNPSQGVVQSRLLQNKGKIYVLCTHSHHDHFNSEILQWKNQRSDIQYIFSSDILVDQMAGEQAAIYLDKLGEYRDEMLYIKAYGSTDKGISFYIEVDGKKIFHAGDLNNWHWNEESTTEEIAEAESFFESELSTLANDVTEIDVALFPLDPRLGKDYMKGAQQFVSRIKTRIFAPMHFDTAYSQVAAFADYAKKENCQYIDWQHKGESFLIK